MSRAIGGGGIDSGLQTIRWHKISVQLFFIWAKNGEATTDDLLENIFSRFCIVK
ncbi:MAG: hypothetical protein AAGI25_09730 [Bacteroidota bacterium]